MPPFAGSRTRHAVVTVVVRQGFTVMTRNEAQWLRAWRYSNHLIGVFDGYLVLVTEHGWLEPFSQTGAAHPRMRLP